MTKSIGLPGLHAVSSWRRRRWRANNARDDTTKRKKLPKPLVFERFITVNMNCDEDMIMEKIEINKLPLVTCDDVHSPRRMATSYATVCVALCLHCKQTQTR